MYNHIYFDHYTHFYYSGKNNHRRYILHYREVHAIKQFHEQLGENLFIKKLLTQPICNGVFFKLLL